MIIFITGLAANLLYFNVLTPPPFNPMHLGAYDELKAKLYIHIEMDFGKNTSKFQS